MDGHLIAVEVGIKCRADKGVKLDRLSFDKHRLKGLNAQPVQRGGSVEEYRVLLDDLIEDIPYFGALLFHHLLGAFYGGYDPPFLEFVVYERSEQLECHFLGNPALVEPEIGPHYDNRSAGVVDPLSQQVLSESPPFSFEHIAQ